MAVELIGFPKMDEQKAIQKAASEGLKGMEHLINLLSQQTSHSPLQTDLTDVTVSKFKKLISLLNRTGHARFRRAPLQSSPSSLSLPQPNILTPSPANFTSRPAANPVVVHHPQTLTLDFTKPNNNILTSNNKSLELEFSKETTFSVSSNSSFMSSSITGDGSVSNGKQGSSIFLTPAVSGGKPPLSSASFKKRCLDHRENADNVSGSSKCHCNKKRYTLRLTV